MALSASLRWTRASLDRVLHDLQGAIHPDASAVTSVGATTLYPHQREAIALLLPVLRRYGGALLADPVGTGKTWSALGVAIHYERVLVVTPAAVRPMWTAALARAGRTAALLTHESLSRGPPTDERYDLVIVDEAHHARNPGTRRYKALASIAWGADVLLLTATPLHNRTTDLRALCALFLGSGAKSLEPELLSRLICRRAGSGITVDLPRVAGLRWLDIGDTSDVLQQILALPPAIPPSDGGRAAALGTYVLVRQWCSSDGALIAALDRRLRIGAVMAHRLSQGRLPTRRELAGWMSDAGAIQLTLALDRDEPATTADVIATQLAGHLDAVRLLRNAVRADPARDEQRCAALLTVLASEHGKRAVLFTHSIDTARVWFSRLSPQLRAACLDGHGGRVSSGRVSREEIIHAFLPHRVANDDSSEARDDPMRIDVLIATDVVSEGVDLHDASVVVHLDLPWTVARLEQRLGRLRRIGSPHGEVTQYAFRPPSTGEDILRLLDRLAAKAQLVDSLIGYSTDGVGPLPGFIVGDSPAPADSQERLREITRRWTRHSAPARTSDVRSRASAVRVDGESAGFLAVVTLGGERQLLGGLGQEVVTGPAQLACLAERVSRREVDAPVDAVISAARLIGDWLDVELTRWAMLTGTGGRSEAHHAVLRTLNTLLVVARRAARQDVMREMTALRHLVLDATGVGAEQLMTAWLAEARPPTAESLHALAATLRKRVRSRAPDMNAGIHAILLLVPG